jgi:hypothetical protein
MAGLVAVVIKHREACPEPSPAIGRARGTPEVPREAAQPTLRQRWARVELPRARARGFDVYRRG